jgi:subtilisin family serine protease
MNVRFYLLCLLVVIAASSDAQNIAQADLQALLELNALVAKNDKPKSLIEATGAFPVAEVHGQATVGFLGRLTGGVTESEWRDWAANEEAITAGAYRQGIASFRVDAYALDALWQTPMALVELASRAVPDVNKVRYGTRVDSVHAGFNLPQPFHGEGVLIGVLDWGFDYTHPMFRDTTLSTSRIRAVWDQYRQAGPTPGEYGYGTVAESPLDIQLMESDTSNVYGYSTHGTHVAGIAGGSGAGIGLKGMAPAAEFLFATLMVDEASALDAYDWMQSIAEADGKRLVINNSWGLPQWGTPDGTSLSNQFIDAMSDEGVVFVSSNGNNGDVDFHLDHTFEAPGDTVRSRVKFYPLSANPNTWGQNLTLWGEIGESFEMGFLLTVGLSTVVGESPMYSTNDGPLLLDTIQVVNNDTIIYDLVLEPSHPANGRPFMQMRIRKGGANVAVAMQLTGESGRVHAWNHTHLSNDVGNWGQDFQAAQSGWLAGDPFYGIQQPACGHSVIAVGAYASEYLNPVGTEVGGTLANFSTYGPTLDERLKPNVSAPGVSVESSLSSFRDGGYSITSTVEFDGTEYEFARLSGTSMSGPAVAGVVALMLEANPELTPADIRSILESTAREDEDTGTLPAIGDHVWGHGKVNAAQAVLAALTWDSSMSAPEIAINHVTLFPNPVRNQLWFSGMSSGSATWEIFDLRGQICQTGQAFDLSSVDVSTLQPGLYIIHVQSAHISQGFKFLKHP